MSSVERAEKRGAGGDLPVEEVSARSARVEDEAASARGASRDSASAHDGALREDSARREDGAPRGDGTPRKDGPSAGTTLAQAVFEGPGWVIARLVTDVLLLILAIVCARVGAPDAAVDREAGIIWLFPPLVVLLLAARGLYGRSLAVRMLDKSLQVVSATSLAAISLVAVAAFVEPEAPPGPLLARVWFFGTLYVVAGRLVLAVNQRRARATSAVGKPTLIVGAGVVGGQVERRLREQPEFGLRPVGYLDADPAPSELVPERRLPVLGTPAELAAVAEETHAQHVVLAFLSGPDSQLLPIVQECERRRLELSLVPRLFESINTRVALEHIGGLPLFGLRTVDPKGWQFAIKHACDRLVAALALVVLSPVMLGAALAVKLSSPGPVLFRQRRIGRDGREFEILKYRSMAVVDSEELRRLAILHAHDTAPGGVEGVDRRTGVGALLRRTSIDELPQLFNVLKGQMSIVGPRPERPEFVELFGQQIRRYEDRHRVKSGITGWAQVHGLRGKTSLADRIEWDNYYIANWSLWLDIKILLLTVGALCRPVE